MPRMTPERLKDLDEVGLEPGAVGWWREQVMTEAKRARASEERLIEALKGVLFMLDRHEVTPEMKDTHNTEACCVCVARAAIKGAE